MTATSVSSVVIGPSAASALTEHLLRADGQEDVCFAVWHPSRGATRTSAVVKEVILPEAGERHLHGNVSFESSYFLRASAAAAQEGGGIALLHSHPGGRGWQRLSDDDHHAEESHAGPTIVLTGLPLIGLTLAGDGTFSARSWRRTGTRTYAPVWCRSTRVLTEGLSVSFDPTVAPVPIPEAQMARTASAWGPGTQATIARMTVGVCGVGSVGALVAEQLVRTGFGRVVLIDFDNVKQHNLDRLAHATNTDAVLVRSKTATVSRALRRLRPSLQTQIVDVPFSVVEASGLDAAKDCDVLVSCVDRPAGRHVLNSLAYAHAIPVIDGGVSVSAGPMGIRGAEWRAHVVGPERRCMECLGQLDVSLVQADRDGLLDAPGYIKDLPVDHPLRHGENVFAFAAAAASAQVLAVLRLITQPAGLSDAGAQLFHFTTGTVETDLGACDRDCPSTSRVSLGDSARVPIAYVHETARRERSEAASVTTRIRVMRALDDLVSMVPSGVGRLARHSQRVNKSER